MADIAVLPWIISIPAFVVIAVVIVDAARRTDLSGMRKALWIGAAVVLPVVGAFLYLLSRPFVDPAHTVVRGNKPTTDLIELLMQRGAGTIGDEDFEARKRRIFEEATTAAD